MARQARDGEAEKINERQTKVDEQEEKSCAMLTTDILAPEAKKSK